MMSNISSIESVASGPVISLHTKICAIKLTLKREKSALCIVADARIHVVNKE